MYADGHGELTGYAYASPHHERAAYQWSVNVAVYVRAGQHRRGIGRALYETLGFRPVGVYRSVGWKMGAWHDVGWWQLVLQDRPATPAPPLTLAQARSLTAWPAGVA